MHPGNDDESTQGNEQSDQPRDTADLTAESADATADTPPVAADQVPSTDPVPSAGRTPSIRPAVTQDTVPGLPNIAASPRRFPPIEPPPGRPGRRTALAALVVLVAVLVAGAVIGRLTAPRSSIVAVPTSTGPDAITATVPPVAPSPSSAPTVLSRPADALAPWASRVGVVLDVPAVALQAYGYAQLVLQSAAPNCHLGWTTLAGIGEVASHHGQAGGAVLDQGGRSTPPIVGPPLDGRDGRALVADTDAGAFDADPNHDRALGPMLLLPATWRLYASDGDDDQIQDPYDIDDASVAVARSLCSGGEDLQLLSGWTAAVARLQPGSEYANAVFQAADSYGQRSRDIE
jgi:membrane-bound lytic murein transglycosylase B